MSLRTAQSVRLSLVRSMKARSDHYLAVLNLVRLWCHPYDRPTVVRVMGVIKLAVKGREAWMTLAVLPPQSSAWRPSLSSLTARAVGGRAELRPTNVRYVPVPDGRQGQPEDSRAFLGMSERKVQELATIRDVNRPS